MVIATFTSRQPLELKTSNFSQRFANLLKLKDIKIIPAFMKPRETQRKLPDILRDFNDKLITQQSGLQYETTDNSIPVVGPQRKVLNELYLENHSEQSNKLSKNPQDNNVIKRKNLHDEIHEQEDYDYDVHTKSRKYRTKQTNQCHNSTSLNSRSIDKSISYADILKNPIKHSRYLNIRIVLESCFHISGGLIRGNIAISYDKNSDLQIGSLYVDVIGVESLKTNYSTIFFASRTCIIHSAHCLPRSEIFKSLRSDLEDTWKNKNKKYGDISFSISLPLECGPSSIETSVASIKYFLLVSLKYKREEQHYMIRKYKRIYIYPAVDPQLALKPLEVNLSSESQVYWNKNCGPLSIRANIHRTTWIAGQHIPVEIFVSNRSNKIIKSISAKLNKTVLIYPIPSAYFSNVGSLTHIRVPNKVKTSCVSSSKNKISAYSTNESDWCGVKASENCIIMREIYIPSDAVSISMVSLFEIRYFITVHVNGKKNPFAMLPINVISIRSVDPGPWDIGHLYKQIEEVKIQPRQADSSNFNDVETINIKLSDNYRARRRLFAGKYNRQTLLGSETLKLERCNNIKYAISLSIRIPLIDISTEAYSYARTVENKDISEQSISEDPDASVSNKENQLSEQGQLSKEYENLFV